MQEIVENKPDQCQNGDPRGNHLESPDGINAIRVVAIITTRNGVTIRVFHAGFVTSGFFPAGFHGVAWEGPL